MPDTTYQYSLSGDGLSNGTQTGTFSGTFRADYASVTATGSITVTTPNGTDVFNFTNANISKGSGDPNQFTLNATSATGIFSLTYTGYAPTSLDFASYQYTAANVASYQAPSGSPISSTNTTPCFAAGTLITTPQGGVLVEALRVGDVIVTSAGAHRSIKWLGHRHVVCRKHPRPHEVMPVRIAGHAFGQNRPTRDLRVSPGHAICVDVVGEVLIPAAALVNGTTIVQEQVDTITYWHVELEGGHDIILADNLPCESYIEMGNRSFFAEKDAVELHGIPDARAITHADFCRPFHKDGSVVMFVRERLAARSPDLGWTLEEEPLADMHLLVDGRRVDAETSGLCARFLVPGGSEEVWLISHTSVPAEIALVPDLRSLGVCVGSLVLDDGFGSPITISADHPLLSAGFHNVEEGPQRWTAGRSRLPAELWDGCRGSFFLRVELTRPALPRWIAPKTAVNERPARLVC